MTIAIVFAFAGTPWAWFAVGATLVLYFVGAGCSGTAEGREEWFARIGRETERKKGREG